MDGILPIWKPVDMSSFDVIRTIKRTLLPQLSHKVKIGHAGTLDPFADGVLLVMLGRSTKRFDEIMTWGKTYRAVACLGASSDTLDRTGVITQSSLPSLTHSQVENIAAQFVGEIDQVIPQFSAAKYKGKPRYLYARTGETVPSKSKKVTISSLTCPRLTDREAEFVVSCSSGTYIRQLSFDILRAVGVDSYLTALTREAVGPITRERCLALDQVGNVDMVMQHLLPAPDASASSSVHQ